MDVETMEKVVPDLLDVMEVDVILLRKLVSLDALTRQKKDDIMAEKTNADKVDNLMEHIMKDIKNKYEPLLDALRHTKQYSAVTILETASGGPPGASNAPIDTKSTKASGVMTSQVPLDEAIKKTGKAIKKALYDNQVYLKSDAGLEMTAKAVDYVRQWQILSEDNRSSLKELTKMSEKLAFVLSALEKRPAVELVLFGKVLILTGQGHHLEDIGLSLKEIKAIDETYCRDKCRSGHE